MHIDGSTSPAAAGTRAATTWERFEHGADIGVRGRGATLADAVAGAAMALTSVVVDPDQVAPIQRVELACAAADEALLLVAWLNALVYEMATRRMLFARFAVEVADRSVRAVAWGERIDPRRHQPAVEIKGATLTSLRVAREPDGTWVAQTVVDV